MPMRIAVCVSGGGSNLEALIRSLRGFEQARLVVVISNREGVGALAKARAADLPTAVLADPGDAGEWLGLLRQYEVDLIVLAGYLKLVPPEVISAYRDRIINIHPALLPAFGGPGMYGLRVHQAVLASGARVSGCTVHLVDEVYDRGAILSQALVPVLPGDSAEALAARVLEAEHRLLPTVVRAAAMAGRPVPISQQAESEP
jgi:formyltetrahydrofolate-dependent phosphoribosylglycinamide formyltransferase